MRYHQKNKGYCYVCHNNVTFSSKDEDYRNNYLCSNCYSLPRMRALYYVLHLRAPGWKKKNIHECSPHPAVIDFFKAECKGYLPTYYYPEVEPGTLHDGFRCEDLQKTTFEEQSFDLIITSDVMEHIPDPWDAYRDMARTLKPGGMHIFTVPAYFHIAKTEMRIQMADGIIQHLKEPQYHGDPINDKGSLVTIDYGQDIGHRIFQESGLITTIYVIRDEKFGILGNLSEVFVSVKESAGKT